MFYYVNDGIFDEKISIADNFNWFGFHVLSCTAGQGHGSDNNCAAGSRAMAAAEKAQPYILRGLKGGLKGFCDMGMDMIDIFRLPLGVLQVTLGAPFGYFKDGIRNVVLGFVAPFKLAFHTVMLPVRFCGF